MDQKTQVYVISRRHLIKICGLAALARPIYGKSANNTVRIGIIGCGRRSHGISTQFLKIKDVAIVALCDPDPARVESLAKDLANKGFNASGMTKFQDYRRLLERPDIDAVVVTSPNHWHALHAIHAMQAGKDAYLEKPVTHELWEGHQLIAAEEKYGRIIAAGFQSRSDPGTRDGIQFVREGHLGKIQSVHVCCFKDRDSIGIRKKPLTPPPGTDYGLWLGPAADLPLCREEFHYDWHWAWNTGNGDIGKISSTPSAHAAARTSPRAFALPSAPRRSPTSRTFPIAPAKKSRSRPWRNSLPRIQSCRPFYPIRESNSQTGASQPRNTTSDVSSTSTPLPPRSPPRTSTRH